MLIGGEPGLGVLGWKANLQSSAANTVIHAGTILIKDKESVDKSVHKSIAKKSASTPVFELAPGETIESPISFFALAKGDDDNVGNETFRYLQRYVFLAPLPNSPLVTYCIW